MLFGLLVISSWPQVRRKARAETRIFIAPAAGVKAISAHPAGAALPPAARAGSLDAAMLAAGPSLVFDPLALSAVLFWAAAAALAWELVALVVWLARRRGPARAAALAVGSLLAGPVLAPVAAVYGAMTAGADRPMPGRTAALAALRGTLLAGLAAVLLALPAEGASPHPSGAVLVLAACATAWCLRSYRRTTSPLGRASKGLLLALRLAVVLLVALWALRPTLAYTRRREVRRAVVVAVDASRSMARRDMPAAYPRPDLDPDVEPIARMDAVRRELARSRDALRDLRDNADVAFYAFAAAEDLRRLRREDGKLALPGADGTVTAIGDAAQQVFDEFVRRQRDVAVIVVLSDGCNNATDRIGPEAFAALMGSRRVPVHTVGVGRETVSASTRALTVRDLDSQDRVDAFHRLPIGVEVRALGIRGRQVKVTCRFGDEQVGAETFTCDADTVARTIRFEHVPLHTGFHRLQVRAECVGPPPRNLAGEPEAAKLVHVVQRQLRLMLVEGKVRFELKFLTQALAAAKDFSLERYVLLDPLGADRPTPLSERLEDWLTYHAIIFGDVSSAQFTRKQLEIIRDLVRDYGKGFCMIGGSGSFGRGGWAATPLADVLGVDLLRSAGQIDRPVRVVPTPEGSRQEFMRIGPAGQSAEAAWARLRALPGANRLAGPKRTAAVLARSERGEPLIVAMPYGKGRSLAIAFDTTWRWVLSPDDTAELQKRFWRQVAYYLCAPTGHAWITTDQTRYELRPLLNRTRTIEVTAGVEDPKGRALPAAAIEATLTRPDGSTVRLDLPPEGQVRRRRLGPAMVRRPGLHVLKIAAEVAGEELSAETRFEVTRRDLEALDALADLDLLRRVAEASGGRFRKLQYLGELLKTIRVHARPKEETYVEPRELSDELRWYVVAALIALLCAEWALRKRRGLV
jgi:uncharacterized membrane protein